MADSPVALSTFGTSTTVIKVVVFCLSAFLAGIGGAVLGPVTGQISGSPFGAFRSLLLVVILALQVPFGQMLAPFTAAIAMIVLPSYLTNPEVNKWLAVVFGVAAISVAMRQGSRGQVDVTNDQPRPKGAARFRPAEQRRAGLGPARLRTLEPRWPKARVRTEIS
jgi:ABC-type branched-subunit amino acid transport system permease subunit